jgi:DNA-binding GntR family transcriptional regulator
VVISRTRGKAQPVALLPSICRRVKDAIASGELKPGAKLSPSSLAAGLGVSHIPVREALASLAAFGYIEHRPRVGFFVHTRSAADLADIVHWRGILEDEAFRMAIPRLDTADIAHMRQLCDELHELEAPELRGEYLAVNRRFHFVVFRRAGSERLLSFLAYLWDLAAPYTYGSPAAHARPDGHFPADDHAQLVDLFESGDVDGAIAAMARHRESCLPGLSRLDANAE